MCLKCHGLPVRRLTRCARSLHNSLACPYDRLIYSGKPKKKYWRVLFQPIAAFKLAHSGIKVRWPSRPSPSWTTGYFR